MSVTEIRAAETFGDVIELHAAFTEKPPERDDVLTGLEPGNVACLGGPGGGSKTFFVLNLGFDLALGGSSPAVRTELVPHRKFQSVGICTAEESVSELQRRLFALGNHLCEDERAAVLPLLTITSLRREIPILVERDGSVNETTRDKIERFSYGKRLVVLDPLGRFCRGDKNDEAVMVTLVTTLEGIAQSSGCVFLLPHHTGKNAQLTGNGDSSLAMKGSTALVESCRYAAMIFRPSKRIAEAREIDARRFRIVKIDKANHRKDKEEVWFEVRDDGSLQFDAVKTLNIMPTISEVIAPKTSSKKQSSQKYKTSSPREAFFSQIKAEEKLPVVFEGDEEDPGF